MSRSGHTERRTVYQGSEAYVAIDLKAYRETGEIRPSSEPFVADKAVTRVDRAGFEITYMAYLLDVFDQLGGKRYKVFKYIIEHKSSDNTLIITNGELAERVGVSRKTVTETLRLLKEKNLIATRLGAIMLLPKVAHRGSPGKEAYLMHKFEAFGELGEMPEESKTPTADEVEAAWGVVKQAIEG